MVKRVITGAGLIAVVVGFFFLRNYVDIRLFNILIGVFSVLGAWEMTRALGDKMTVAQKVISLIYATALVPFYTFFGIKSVLLLFAGFIVINLSLLVLDNKRTELDNLGYSLLVGVYPAIGLLAMLMINSLGELSNFALIFVFIVSPCADTFAYLVGCTLKGPKLCPSISPKKTISGGIGGLIGGIVGGVVLYAIMKPSLDVSMPYLFMVAIGLVASVITAFGDLVESVIKRKLGIKDMGKILPGHGGVLDRIDGILFASIAVCLIFSIV